MEVLVSCSHHVPLPEVVFLAMCSICILWDWPDVLVLIVVGFLGLLRPGEALALRTCDILLPSATLVIPPATNIHLRNSKLARLGARREHVRIDDLEVTSLLEGLLSQRPTHSPIFNGSAKDFSTLSNALLDVLNLPTGDGHGLTPASLRSGGATFWYRHTDATEWVRFRGRWASACMLEIYIQEVASLTILSKIGFNARRRIHYLALAAPLLFRELQCRLPAPLLPEGCWL